MNCGVLSIAREDTWGSADRSNVPVFYKLITYIEQHYFERISLSDLANLGGLSGDYVSKIFKKMTSYSVIEYLNNYRLKKAKNLLLRKI